MGNKSFIEIMEKRELSWKFNGKPEFDDFCDYCNAISTDLYEGVRDDKVSFYYYLYALINYAAIKEAIPHLKVELDSNESCMNDIQSIKKNVIVLEEKASGIMTKFPELKRLCNQIKIDIENGENTIFTDNNIREAYTTLARNFEQIYIKLNNSRLSFPIKTPYDIKDQYYSCLDVIKKNLRNQPEINSIYVSLWDLYLKIIEVKNSNISVKDYFETFDFFYDFIKKYMSGKKDFSLTEEMIGIVFGKVYLANTFSGASNVNARVTLKFIMNYIKSGYISDEDYDALEKVAEAIIPSSARNQPYVDSNVSSLITKIVTSYLKQARKIEISEKEMEDIEQGLTYLLLCDISENTPEGQIRLALKTLHEKTQHLEKVPIHSQI